MAEKAAAAVVAFSAGVTACYACTRPSGQAQDQPAGSLMGGPRGWNPGHTRARKPAAASEAGGSAGTAHATPHAAAIGAARALFTAKDFAGAVGAYEEVLAKVGAAGAEGWEIAEAYANCAEARVSGQEGAAEPATMELLNKTVEDCNQSLKANLDPSSKCTWVVLKCRASALMQIGDKLKIKGVDRALDAWSHGYVDILTAENSLEIWRQGLKTNAGADRVRAFTEYHRQTAASAAEIQRQKTELVKRTMAAEVEQCKKARKKTDAGLDKAFKACGSSKKEPVIAQYKCIAKLNVVPRKRIEEDSDKIRGSKGPAVKLDDKLDVLEEHVSESGQLSVRCVLPKCDGQTGRITATDETGKKNLDEILPTSPKSPKRMRVLPAPNSAVEADRSAAAGGSGTAKMASGNQTAVVQCPPASPRAVAELKQQAALIYTFPGRLNSEGVAFIKRIRPALREEQLQHDAPWLPQLAAYSAFLASDGIPDDQECTAILERCQHARELMEQQQFAVALQEWESIARLAWAICDARQVDIEPAMSTNTNTNTKALKKKERALKLQGGDKTRQKSETWLPLATILPLTANIFTICGILYEVQHKFSSGSYLGRTRSTHALESFDRAVDLTKYWGGRGAAKATAARGEGKKNIWLIADNCITKHQFLGESWDCAKAWAHAMRGSFYQPTDQDSFQSKADTSPDFLEQTTQMKQDLVKASELQPWHSDVLLALAKAEPLQAVFQAEVANLNSQLNGRQEAGATKEAVAPHTDNCMAYLETARGLTGRTVATFVETAKLKMEPIIQAALAGEMLSDSGNTHLCIRTMPSNRAACLQHTYDRSRSTTLTAANSVPDIAPLEDILVEVEARREAGGFGAAGAFEATQLRARLYSKLGSLKSANATYDSYIARGQENLEKATRFFEEGGQPLPDKLSSTYLEVTTVPSVLQLLFGASR